MFCYNEFKVNKNGLLVNKAMLFRKQAFTISCYNYFNFTSRNFKLIMVNLYCNKIYKQGYLKY